MSQTDSQNRIGIIQAIKTPLGFFTMVVLVVEIVFGFAAGLSQGSDRTYLIIGMLGLMFSLVFIVAALASFRPEALTGKRPKNENHNFSDLSSTERIAKYRALIEKETQNNLLSNFYVPDGYTAEVSTITGLPFGFCYPEHWVFSRMPQDVKYGIVKDVQSEKEIGFCRNVNIIVDDISNYEGELNKLYQAGLEQVLSMLSKTTLVFQDTEYIFQGLPAMRSRIDWVPQTEEMHIITLYQYQVANKERNKLYTISFTTRKDDFEKSRPVFDNIANTFRI